MILVVVGGDRLLGAMSMGVNYFGTDPNYLLVDRLINMVNFFNYQSSEINIKAQGSEIFIPEWENTIGLAFSSPPYFNLEDYQIGEQSYKEGTTYNNWLNNYFNKTISNIYKYLIDDGVLALNINNFDKYNLVEDCNSIILKNGFQPIEIMALNNTKRINELSKLNDNSERIMIYKKAKG